MADIKTFEDPIKFKPDYSWPVEGTQRSCPKCGLSLQLNENRPDYFGKPWWCGACRWQFSEEELSE